MKPIKGVYRIPHLNLAFFVISSPEEKNSMLPGNKKTMEYFERILLLKDRILPIADRQWRIKRVHENHFLESIRRCRSKGQECTSQSSDNLEYMGLLALNPGESCDSDPTYFTPKLLDSVGINDIIEVFI